MALDHSGGKKGGDVRSLLGRGSDERAGLEEVVITQQGQELDRVEEVRLPHRVRPRDAGEWSEVDRDILKVLESGDFKTGEHVFTFNRRRQKPVKLYHIAPGM